MFDIIKYFTLSLVVFNSPYVLSEERPKSINSSTKVEKAPKVKTSKAARSKLSNIQKIDILEKRLKKDSTNERYRKVLAGLYMKEAKYSKAVDQFQLLLKQEDLESYLNLAEAYRLDGNYLSEIRILNQLVPRYPNYPNLYVLQANAFTKIEKYDDATIKYRKALSIQPKYEEAYWGMYQLFQLQKNNYEGRLVLLDMIKRFGKKPKFHTELCRLYTEDSFFEESLKFCQTAVRLSPSTADNHVYLGVTQQYKGNAVQAEKILTNAARQFPKNSFAQGSAGKVLETKENFEMASYYFNRCARIDPTKVDCWKGAARTYFQIGKYKQSLAAYDTVCQLDRTVLTEFKKQAALLRIHKKSDWHEKFTQGITKCYY